MSDPLPTDTLSSTCTQRSPMVRDIHHAIAQAQYRDKNLDATRASARERMRRHVPPFTTTTATLTYNRRREALRQDPVAHEEALARRRSRDGVVRERARQRKFCETYGQEAYYTYYEQAPELTGRNTFPDPHLICEGDKGPVRYTPQATGASRVGRPPKPRIIGMTWRGTDGAIVNGKSKCTRPYK
ncbi:unnamed protein product [Mycena citricolor]|uniref:Uncharacterized protein n=1 Tax=Mycena citricolor TaxID=2018698 RepID=A0AAD2HTL8_9AGAR|nr:unnamed protein product [Mycena citricolor]